ncbi:hypothetical protein BLNAU_11933 [Blattamonas nauphoetae]|uniref:NUA/TPR/MLP1-2-like domain-containing protein n=1 Tax=Blattamonas nauphoetae TaxID=2049346 RepID=A0ABQ9XP38_9EUKA|nr:hypothetical protein BLNAU_11933 [Blattamonas nauphoetae]
MLEVLVNDLSLQIQVLLAEASQKPREKCSSQEITDSEPQDESVQTFDRHIPFTSISSLQKQNVELTVLVRQLSTQLHDLKQEHQSAQELSSQNSLIRSQSLFRTQQSDEDFDITLKLKEKEEELNKLKKSQQEQALYISTVLHQRDLLRNILDANGIIVESSALLPSGTNPSNLPPRVLEMQEKLIDERIAPLQKKLDERDESLKQQSHQNGLLQADNKSLKVEAQKAHEQIRWLREEIKQQSKTVHQLTKAKSEADNLIRHLQTTIETNKLTAQSEDYDHERDAKERETVTAENKRLKEDLNRTESLLTTMTTDLKAKTSLIANLHTTIASLSSQITIIQAEAATTQNALAASQNEIQQLKTELIEKNSALVLSSKENEIALDNVNQFLANMESQCSTLEAEKAELISKHQDELKKAAAEVEDICLQMDALAQENSRLQNSSNYYTVLRAEKAGIDFTSAHAPPGSALSIMMESRQQTIDRQQIEELQSHLAVSRNECNVYKEMITLRDNEIASIRAIAAEAEAAHSKIQEQMVEYHKSLVQESEQWRATLQSQTDQIIASERAQAQQQVAEHQKVSDQSRKLAEQNSMLVEDIRSVLSFSLVTQQLLSQHDDNSSVVLCTKSRLDELVTDSNRFQQKVKELEREKERSDALLTEARKRAENLLIQHAEGSREMEALKQELNGRATHIAELETEQLRLETMVASLEKERELKEIELKEKEQLELKRKEEIDQMIALFESRTGDSQSSPPAEPSDEEKQGLWSVVDYLRLERRAADAEKHIIQQRLTSANGTIELLNKKLKDIEKELREEKVKATSSPIECFWADGTSTKYNKTDDLVSEMKILSQKNNTLKTSSIYQQIEIETLTTQLKDEIVKIEEKQKELEALKSQLAIAQAEKVEADREHLVWKEKMDVIVQNYNTLRTEKETKDKEALNELAEKQAAITNLQKNCDDLATEVKVKTTEVERLQQELLEMKTQQDEQLKRAERELALIRIKMAKADKLVEELNQKATKMNLDMVNVRQESARAATQFRNMLHSKESEYIAQIKHLDAKVRELQRLPGDPSLLEAQNQRSNLESTIDQLHAELDEYRNKQTVDLNLQTQLKADLEEAQRLNKILSNRNKKLTEQNQLLQTPKANTPVIYTEPPIIVGKKRNLAELDEDTPVVMEKEPRLEEQTPSELPTTQIQPRHSITLSPSSTFNVPQRLSPPRPPATASVPVVHVSPKHAHPIVTEPPSEDDKPSKGSSLFGRLSLEFAEEFSPEQYESPEPIPLDAYLSGESQVPDAEAIQLGEDAIPEDNTQTVFEEEETADRNDQEIEEGDHAEGDEIEDENQEKHEGDEGEAAEVDEGDEEKAAGEVDEGEPEGSTETHQDFDGQIQTGIVEEPAQDEDTQMEPDAEADGTGNASPPRPHPDAQPTVLAVAKDEHEHEDELQEEVENEEIENVIEGSEEDQDGNEGNEEEAEEDAVNEGDEANEGEEENGEREEGIDEEQGEDFAEDNTPEEETQLVDSLNDEHEMLGDLDEAQKEPLDEDIGSQDEHQEDDEEFGEEDEYEDDFEEDEEGEGGEDQGEDDLPINRTDNSSPPNPSID